MDRERIIFLPNQQKTLAFGKALGALLQTNSILALKGNLGAGKTTLTQGIGLGLDIDQPILSPTYVYLNLYEGKYPLYHFDLYRLKKPSDFLSLGFEEYFERDGISIIEWPERILPLLPTSTIFITLQESHEGRLAKIEVNETTPLANDLIQFLSQYETT